MITKITQSFIKSMQSYDDGKECGNIIRHLWVDDKLTESSDEMKLGAYFEYILGNLLLGDGKGALPKDGKVPEPELYAKQRERYAIAKEEGRPLVVAESDMMGPYQLAHKNSKRVKQYFDKWGLKVLHVGKTYTKGRFKGTIDIVAECTRMVNFDSGITWRKGEILCIDTKYSGLIDERWMDMGWAWTDNQKRHHKVQARQYHYLTGMPFYYLVVSSKNEHDIRMFYIPVDEGQVESHIKLGNIMMKKFKTAVEVGLIARPEISKCLDCPLFATCEDKHEYPHPETIEI